MNMRLPVLLFLLCVSTMLVACVSDGNLKRSDKFQGIAERLGEEITLAGKLYKPEGDGPFPVVVLLHRCAGIELYDYSWAARLQSWGYVAFVVDSFGPRRVSNSCGNSGSVGYKDRAMDAYSAKLYLSGLSFVDPEKIAVMGWSHGGNGVLQALDPIMRDLLAPEQREPFKAGISFYPYCFNWLDDLSAPLLILAAEKDDWTPVDYCVNKIPKKKTKHEVRLKILEDAHHCFDCTGMNKHYMGHTLRFNQKAKSESIIQVERFLNKYLKE